MKTVVPGYYKKFKCIADKCTHSCCIGWEIDIDEETMHKYKLLQGDMGERIRANIEGEVPHFVLDRDERCPFLNEKGLCDIITEYNEDMLCEICSMHPRFCNFYTDFTEMGIGLCCEEAARIILAEKEPFCMEADAEVCATEEENEFFARRNELIRILQNRSVGIKERFSTLAKMFGMSFSFSLKSLSRLYMSLERLDEAWTDELCNIAEYTFDETIFDETELIIPFEQLAIYFLFRHPDRALYEDDYAGWVRFSLMSCYLIGAICSYHKSIEQNITVEKMADICRMYSSEIEYSEQNMENI